jgi:hypothetical protein
VKARPRAWRGLGQQQGMGLGDGERLGKGLSEGGGKGLAWASAKVRDGPGQGQG